MKELSIEDKAKLYDEVLKAAIIAHKDEDRHLKATLERVFPELKENKDERIRKALLEMMHDTPNNLVWADYGISKKDAIAWLEKQSEQKSTEWSEEDEKNINFLYELLTDLQVKSTENEIKHGTNSRSEYYYNIKKWIKSLKYRYIWKPSDEQMNDLKIAIDSFTFETDYLQELYNDLKKLK